MENKNPAGTLEENKENLLEVHDLWVEYRTSRGAVKAVNGLNLNIAMGETLGLVGETGAGKSTTAFSIMRILPDPPAKITGGEILYKGRDLLKLSAKEMDMRDIPYSMERTNSSFDNAYLCFNRVKAITVRLAEIENSIYRLAVSIKRTQKRANALKNIMIPRFRENVRYISNALEEKEREEFSRQKVIKKAKMKKNA